MHQAHARGWPFLMRGFWNCRWPPAVALFRDSGIPRGGRKRRRATQRARLPENHSMFSQTVQDAINEQICNELSASYSYLAMSCYCERQNFLGCAHRLRIQSEEEYGHGMRLLDFLLA